MKMFAKRYLLKERIIKFVFILMMFVSLLQTYSLVKTHFTHVDDLGVAWTLLSHDTSINQTCIQRFNASKERWYSFVFPLKKIICNDLYKELDRFRAVSSRWTYAPFQFWFTQELFKTKDRLPYEEVKFRGRLPSYLFFITYLFCFYAFIVLKIKTLNVRSFIPLTLVSLACFSLESRIMASQMHSYAIGLLSATICLWTFFVIAGTKKLKPIQIICAAIALSIAIAMQYQAILLVVSGILFVAINWIKRHQSNEILREGLHITLLVALTSLIAFTLVGDIRGLSKYGINWNAGPKNIFMVLGNGFFERLLSLFNLVASNSAYNLYSILSPLELDDLWANTFGVFFLLVLVFGFIYLLKSKNPNDKNILLLTISYGFVYIYFIYEGLLTYSPTRHLLFSLPIILIILGFGMLQIQNYLLKLGISELLPCGFALMFMVSLLNFNTFYQKRLDPISNQLFKEIQAENSADFWLVGLHDLEWRFMPALNEKKIYVYQDTKCIKEKSLESFGPNITFIWYSKRKELNISDPEFKNFIDSQVLGGCGIKPRNFNYSIIYLSSIKSNVGNVEVDLSDRTRNGSNSYYFQKFRINFK